MLHRAIATLFVLAAPVALRAQAPASAPEHAGCLPKQERAIPPLAGVRLDAKQRAQLRTIDARYAPQRDTVTRALRTARRAAARAREAQDFAAIEPTLHAIDSLRTREKAIASAWRLDVRPILTDAQRRRMDVNVVRARGFEPEPPKGQKWAPCSADSAKKG